MINRPAAHGNPDSPQRKNALFTGHDLGAENWATFASPIETCKLGGINPQAYLADVLARIVLRGDTDPIDDLLPYNWVDSGATASHVIDQAPLWGCFSAYLPRTTRRYSMSLP